MINKNYILIVCFVMLLIFMMPISAKQVTAKVDDKGLLYDSKTEIIGTLHTEYGTIIVNDEDYNNIQVNDTITYNTDKNTF